MVIVAKIFHCVVNQFEKSDQCKNTSTNICQQFEKALSKVGITKYHHLTGEEVRNTRDIVDMLRWVLVSIEMYWCPHLTITSTSWLVVTFYHNNR